MSDDDDQKNQFAKPPFFGSAEADTIMNEVGECLTDHGERIAAQEARIADLEAQVRRLVAQHERLRAALHGEHEPDGR